MIDTVSLEPNANADHHLRHIPEAAWSRPIGAPVLSAGQREPVTHPLIDDGPYQGLPLGGLGTGAIGRTFRGDFARWHLEVGRHHYAPAFANQFSLYVEQNGQRCSQVLCTERPDTLLQDWQWSYPSGAGSYHALFPRAWFDYRWEHLPVRLTQEQFSPVIPGNERESSYPVAVFEWRVENPTSEPVRLGLMLTWENLLGQAVLGAPAAIPGHNINVAREEAGLVGVVMQRTDPWSGNAWDGTLAIAAPEVPGVTVTYRSRFTIDERGTDVWDDFASDGQLDNLDDQQPAADHAIGAALAVTFELQPGETKIIPFALAWDLPVVSFPAGTRWNKRYTRFFGADGQQAWTIAAEAIRAYPEWQAQIMAWQQPILDDTRRPLWYKTALFNELYFLVDGGTLWVDGPVDTAAGGEVDSKFAYLECYDYPFYATHDVAFYSSWALLKLWPNIERQEMLQFAPTVLQEDLRPVQIQATGVMSVRKKAGALPHDLGAPTEDPFIQANAYNWQDMNVWKDLNLKYVLRVYRDYLLLNDRAFLDQVWPTVPVALDYLLPFDVDGDGLLDHEGADQTYDTWSMEGASAYSGSLLIAALEAARVMAELQGNATRQQQYAEWVERARLSYETKLWNGSYYIYNTGPNAHCDSIMADQLVGQWYAGALGLPSVAPEQHVKTALRTVFANNVMGFANGTMGAVNGMRPDGALDLSDIQAHEVWTGSTYALAALMLQEGLEQEAWQTAWGVYNVTYITHGFWFRTPEAWDENGSFRASMYMRPQSIWAIEHALGRSEDQGK